MTVLSRRRLIGAAALLAFVFAAGASIVSLYPNQAICAKVQAQQWLIAAFHLEKLPTHLPEKADSLPCRPVGSSTPSGSIKRYFPPGVLGCTDQQEELLTRWYSDQLEALHEPSLWSLSGTASKITAYRFLWLRSFHPPVAIRIIINRDWTGSVVVKMASGTGGSDPGILVRAQTLPVGKHGTALLLARVVETHFWTLPTRAAPGGTDGAQWVLEGVEDGRYHIVERWSPWMGDPVHRLAMTLANDVARLQIAPGTVY